jgi:hypothetical protein
VDAAGGVPRRLTEDADDEVAPSFSRDGRRIYFGSRRSGGWQVWSMPAAGGKPRPVTRAGGYAAFESPGGDSLYFSRLDVPGLWSKALPDGAETLVTDRLAAGDWACWRVTSAGVFLRSRPGRDSAEILRLPFGGGAPERVAMLQEEAWSGFAVSPDGSWIVYPRVDRRTSDIRIIENAL